MGFLITLLVFVIIGLIVNVVVNVWGKNSEEACSYTFISNIALTILSVIILVFCCGDNVISRCSHLNQVIDFSKYEERCDSDGKAIEVVLTDKTGKQYIFKSGGE